MIPSWFRLREVMPSDPQDPANAMEVNQLHRALTSLLILPDTEQRIEERFSRPLPPYDPHNASVIQYRTLNPGPHHSNVAFADHLFLLHTASYPRVPAASVMSLEQDQDNNITGACHSRQRTLEWLEQLSRVPPENPRVPSHGLLTGTPPRVLPETNLKEDEMSEDGNDGDDEYEDEEDEEEEDDDDDNDNDNDENKGGNDRDSLRVK
ncbi:hypothetical protein VTN96DRAFT_1760 [Rasamsonia emersonii]